MSKIYKTTIVEELPQTGQAGLMYLIQEASGNFAAYVFINNEFVKVGAETGTVTASTEQSKTVPDNIPTLMETIPIPTGSWIIITMVQFSYNSGGGWRYSFISASSNPTQASSLDKSWEDNGANVGGTTYNSRIVNAIKANSPYRLYLYAQQNSGGSITCRSKYILVRVG